MYCSKTKVKPESSWSEFQDPFLNQSISTRKCTKGLLLQTFYAPFLTHDILIPADCQNSLLEIRAFCWNYDNPAPPQN